MLSDYLSLNFPSYRCWEVIKDELLRLLSRNSMKIIFILRIIGCWLNIERSRFKYWRLEWLLTWTTTKSTGAIPYFNKVTVFIKWTFLLQTQSIMPRFDLVCNFLNSIFIQGITRFALRIFNYTKKINKDHFLPQDLLITDISKLICNRDRNGSFILSRNPWMLKCLFSSITLKLLNFC
jgi:hypothetical protein